MEPHAVRDLGTPKRVGLSMSNTSSADGFVFRKAGPEHYLALARSARGILTVCPTARRSTPSVPQLQTSSDLTSRYYNYSPGFVCPDAYEIAGIIAMDGSSASVKGVFTSTRFQYPEGGPTSFLAANFLMPPWLCIIELAEKTGSLFRLINTTCETVTRTFDYFGKTTTRTEHVLAAVTSGTIGREPFTFTADESGFAMEGDRITYPTDEPLALAPLILMVVGVVACSGLLVAW
ncbi:hypothetical protein BN1723_004587 [Verticillium longisporum]|uniref:Uncharacterized protein n=1 Tax=Verticillium longisporum TaxID=100787 RepID=A0A0G4MA48_VERLO|nr:hypothetical protein HYQ44_019223 [Verticillium longisporum]CRK31184.1 hypothetical protein BN1708_005374 [Verticillium longisporum]CRK39380.1 hypothetical protein BN1723_004587 [Verticillium longisporum]